MDGGDAEHGSVGVKDEREGFFVGDETEAEEALKEGERSGRVSGGKEFDELAGAENGVLGMGRLLWMSACVR